MVGIMLVNDSSFHLGGAGTAAARPGSVALTETETAATVIAPRFKGWAAAPHHKGNADQR